MSIMQSTTYGFDGNLTDHFSVWSDDPAPSTAEQANGVMRFHTQNQLIGDGGVSEGFLSTAASPRYDQSWSTEVTAMVPAGLSDTPKAYDTYLEAILVAMFTTSSGDNYALSSGLHLGDTTQSDRGYISEYAITPYVGEWTEYLEGQGERATADISGRVGIRFDAATKVLTAYNSQQVLLSIDLDATGITDWNMVDTDTFQIGLGFVTAGWHLPQDLALTLDDFAYTLADNMVTGADGNDTFDGHGGDDMVIGGAGIDTLIYAGNSSGYSLARTASGYTVQDRSGTDGTDTLQDVERLTFPDKSFALDMGATQSGGETALLIGAVLPGLLAFDPSKQGLLGTVIGLFDIGYSMKELSGALLRLPIWDVLTGHAIPTNTDIASYLLTNVNGHTPDQTALATAVNALDTESFQGDWLASLALSAANQTHVGLVGLADTGLAYL